MQMIDWGKDGGGSSEAGSVRRGRRREARVRTKWNTFAVRLSAGEMSAGEVAANYPEKLSAASSLVSLNDISHYRVKEETKEVAKRTCGFVWKLWMEKVSS